MQKHRGTENSYWSVSVLASFKPLCFIERVQTIERCHKQLNILFFSIQVEMVSLAFLPLLLICVTTAQSKKLGKRISLTK